ncbi:MAG TPA: AraC family transcriptional regulator [Sphingomonadales bacterium]|nr:AraC family transcriptional regulator [Sphingomonadales bacterium]
MRKTDKKKDVYMPSLPANYPDCANWATVSESTFHDIDQQAACLTDYGQKYQQMSAGRYEGWFKTVLLGSYLGLYFETFNQDLDQWGATPDDHYGIMFLTDDSNSCRLGQKHFDRDSVVYLTPGAEFDFHSKSDARFCVVNIEARAFEQFLAPCLMESGFANRQMTGTFFEHNTARAKMLRLLVFQALEVAAGFKNDAAGKAAVLGIQMSIASAFAGYLSSIWLQNSAHNQILSRENKGLAFRARQHIRHSRGVYVAVDELALELGVSRRSLEYAFRTQFDKSPAEYIRMVQLNEIRSALLSRKNTDRSIGDIAAELNIWHLSRLAQNYQKLFGELPSKTRICRH